MRKCSPQITLPPDRTEQPVDRLQRSKPLRRRTVRHNLAVHSGRCTSTHPPARPPADPPPTDPEQHHRGEPHRSRPDRIATDCVILATGSTYPFPAKSALGDATAIPKPKMAGAARDHATTAAKNINAPTKNRPGPLTPPPGIALPLNPHPKQEPWSSKNIGSHSPNPQVRAQEKTTKPQNPQSTRRRAGPRAGRERHPTQGTDETPPPHRGGLRGLDPRNRTRNEKKRSALREQGASSKWRCRESNPGPPSLHQDFSVRSSLCLCLAPPVSRTSRCDEPSRCWMSHQVPRPDLAVRAS